MKLNPDCVRDLLLSIEDMSGWNTQLFFPTKFETLMKIYDIDELRYHVKQCIEFGFISADKGDFEGNHWISDLKPSGHEFLANMRSDNIWNNTKETAKKIGATSLSAFVQISSNVIAAIIKSQFGLT
jgi:hypothetical protein